MSKVLNKMQFNVLLYNIFTPVPETLKNNGQVERLKRLPQIFRNINLLYNVDAIIVCELIPKNYERSLSFELEKLGFLHKTKAISGHKVVNGGVIIFSKHEILYQDQMCYNDLCEGTDCLAAKGLTYARIQKNGKIFNVFGTHLQSWPDQKAVLTRTNQVARVSRYIKDLNIPKHEPVIFGGDFNIDLYRERQHLEYLLSITNFELPDIHKDSLTFTNDPYNNNLVGIDEISKYSNTDYPNGCEKEYMKTLVCPCCPEEWLDYILYNKRYKQPTSSSLRVLTAKVEPFKMNLTRSKKITTSDVSDHFPVLAEFVFDFEKFSNVDKTFASILEDLEEGGEINKNVDKSNGNVSSGGYIGGIVIFSLLIIFLIYYIYKRKMEKDLYNCYKRKRVWLKS